MKLAFALITAGLFPRAVPAANAAPAPTPLECAASRARARSEARKGTDDLASALRDAERCGQHLDAGRARLLLGDAAGAERSFKKALTADPGDAGALYGLAVATRDRPKEALGYADRAARAGASIQRRAAAHRLAGEIRLDLGDRAGAASSVEAALKLKGDDLEALRDMVLVKRARPGEAAPYAARALAAADAAPAWARSSAYRFCARMYLELKDEKGSALSLRRALALDPDDLDALEALVQLKVRGEPAALPPAKPAADSGELDAMLRRIALLREEKKSAEAAALAESFMDAVPESPSWQITAAYHAVALEWLALGNEEMARQSIRFARELDPRSVEILRLAQRLGAGDGAEDDPTPADAYAAIGRARMSLDDLEGAERSLRKALDLRPDHLEGLAAMTQVKLTRGRPGEALAASDLLLKATESSDPAGWEFAGRRNQLPWEHAAVYDQRARIQVALDDEIGARKSLERSQSLVPDGARQLAVWVELHHRKARVDEALAYCARALKAARKEGLLDVIAALELRQAELEGRLKAAAPGAPLPPEPDRAGEFQRRAKAELDAKRPREALAFLDQAIAVSSTAPAAQRAGLLVRRARIERDLGEADGARRTLASALSLSPSDRATLEESMRLELAMGRAPQALAHARVLLKAEPGDLEALAVVMRGGSRDRAAAAKDFAKAFAADPRGVCFGQPFQPGRDRLDAAYFDACVARFPEDAKLRSDRGVTLWRRGDKTGALADFRKAAELKPGDPDARANLESAISIIRR